MLTDQVIQFRPAAPAVLAPSCRLCGGRLHRTLIDLGPMPLGNRTRAPQEPDTRHPLHIRVCDACLLVQTQDPIPADPDDHLVAPRPPAGIEQSRRFAACMRQRLGLGVSSLVVEVGCCDDTLLRHFHEAGVPVLGIGPAGRDPANLAPGLRTEEGSFNAAAAMDAAVRFGRADLVFAGTGLSQVPDLFDFAAGFAALLRPKGVVVFQFPYILPMIQKAQFDAFRHDRFFYLSLVVMEHVLRSVGLRVFEAERLPDHGGMLRVYACHPRGPHAARPALKTVRQAEAAAGLDRPAGYDGYAAKVQAACEDISEFLKIRHAAGRKVAAYGLATRGNTMLNACGITTQEVAWVVDPDARSLGRLLPGSGLPIRPIETLTENRPDDLLILPWPRAAEIAASLLPLRQRGTQFWTLTPAIKRV